MCVLINRYVTASSWSLYLCLTSEFYAILISMYSENLEFWMIMKSLENFHDLLSVLSIVVAVYTFTQC